ncbi:MAG: hypothetical protein V3R51_03585 [Gammaproteobacteria bacterium]
MVQFVLFEFGPNLALQFDRSPSNHSYGYAFSDDRPNCLAKFALILEPFVQYAGYVALFDGSITSA